MEKLRAPQPRKPSTSFLPTPQHFFLKVGWHPLSYNERPAPDLLLGWKLCLKKNSLSSYF